MADVTHREVLAAVAARLSLAGWRKRSGPLLTRPLTDEVSVGVSLGNATSYGVALAPSISLRHDTVEQVKARLLQREATYKDLTVARNVGYLRPQPGYYNASFAHPVHLDRDVTEVVDLIQGVGLTWARQHTGLADVLAALQERPYALREHQALPVAIALALLDRPGEGRIELRYAADAVPPDSAAGRERRQILAAYDTWSATR